MFAMDNIKFPKQNMNIPQNFKDMSNDINTLLDKNDEAIRGYIVRYIYTSSMSSETTKQLDELFKQARAKLI
jgi:hypothetical protein